MFGDAVWSIENVLCYFGLVSSVLMVFDVDVFGGWSL